MTLLVKNRWYYTATTDKDQKIVFLNYNDQMCDCPFVADEVTCGSWCPQFEAEGALVANGQWQIHAVKLHCCGRRITV